MMPEETVSSATAIAPSPRQPPPAAPAVTPQQQQQANIAELLALARNFLAAQQETPPAAAAAAPAVSVPDESESRPRQRFQRYNPEAPAPIAPAAAPPVVDGAGVAADPGGALKGAAQRRQRAIPANVGPSPTTSPRRSSGRPPLWFSGATLLAGLALGWYFQPRLSRLVPPAEANLPESATDKSPEATALMLPALPPDSLASRAAAPDATALQALALVEDALSAEKARDFNRATRLYEEAYKIDPRVPAAARRLGELSLLRNDASRALIWNNRAFTTGDSLGAAFAQRGVLALRAGNLRAALTSFTAAVHAEPNSARWCFFLAQALRRGGKLQEATKRLKQAAERAEEPQQEEYFLFIARLTQIELGQTEAVATEVATRLLSPTPTADWVLTAAAVELQRGQLEQAAKRMAQVFKNQPPAYAATRLDDVFFRKYETARELAPLYAAYLPRGAGPDASGANRSSPSAALVPPGTAPTGPLLNPLPTPPGTAPTPSQAGSPSPDAR